MRAGLLMRLLGYGVLIGLAGLGLPSLASRGSVLAQELPPFPILYGGRVLIDGEPAPPGIELVAWVGDYETSTVVEENGRYRNLLVAPLSSDYYGMSVTFHALGVTAQEQDEFLGSSAPAFKTTGTAAFDLHFQLPKVPTSPLPGQTPATPEAQPEGRGTTLRMLLYIGLGGLGVVVITGAWVTRRVISRRR